MMKKSILVTIALSAPLASAQTELIPDKADVPEPEKIYSPYVERTVQDKNLAEGLYWGDTHLHTNYSTDSGMIGNRLSPEEAYRFAKGEEVTSSTGQRVRLIRPLDFLVVSDHAENLGLAPMINESNAELLKTEYGRKWHDMVKAGKGYEAFLEWAASVQDGDKINSRKMQRTVWERQLEAADRHNEPGRFTAMGRPRPVLDRREARPAHAGEAPGIDAGGRLRSRPRHPGEPGAEPPHRRHLRRIAPLRGREPGRGRARDRDPGGPQAGPVAGDDEARRQGGQGPAGRAREGPRLRPAFRNARTYSVAATASRTASWMRPLLATMPRFSARVRPIPKPRGSPSRSVTLPPASRTMIEPAAWSQIFSR